MSPRDVPTELTGLLAEKETQPEPSPKTKETLKLEEGEIGSGGGEGDKTSEKKKEDEANQGEEKEKEETDVEEQDGPFRRLIPKKPDQPRNYHLLTAESFSFIVSAGFCVWAQAHYKNEEVRHALLAGTVSILQYANFSATASTKVLAQNVRNDYHHLERVVDVLDERTWRATEAIGWLKGNSKANSKTLGTLKTSVARLEEQVEANSTALGVLQKETRDSFNRVEEDLGKVKEDLGDFKQETRESFTRVDDTLGRIERRVDDTLGRIERLLYTAVGKTTYEFRFGENISKVEFYDGANTGMAVFLKKAITCATEGGQAFDESTFKRLFLEHGSGRKITVGDMKQYATVSQLSATFAEHERCVPNLVKVVIGFSDADEQKEKSQGADKVEQLAKQLLL